MASLYDGILVDIIDLPAGDDLASPKSTPTASTPSSCTATPVPRTLYVSGTRLDHLSKTASKLDELNVKISTIDLTTCCDAELTQELVWEERQLGAGHRAHLSVPSLGSDVSLDFDDVAMLSRSSTSSISSVSHLNSLAGHSGHLSARRTLSHGAPPVSLPACPAPRMDSHSKPPPRGKEYVTVKKTVMWTKWDNNQPGSSVTGNTSVYPEGIGMATRGEGVGTSGGHAPAQEVPAGVNPTQNDIEEGTQGSKVSTVRKMRSMTWELFGSGSKKKAQGVRC